jgi:hypothetical protein
MTYTLEDELKRQQNINAALARELQDLKERREEQVNAAYNQGMIMGNEVCKQRIQHMVDAVFAIDVAVDEYLDTNSLETKRIIRIPFFNLYILTWDPHQLQVIRMVQKIQRAIAFMPT